MVCFPEYVREALLGSLAQTLFSPFVNIVPSFKWMCLSHMLDYWGLILLPKLWLLVRCAAPPAGCSVVIYQVTAPSD